MPVSKKAYSRKVDNLDIYSIKVNYEKDILIYILASTTSCKHISEVHEKSKMMMMMKIIIELLKIFLISPGHEVG